MSKPKPPYPNDEQTSPIARAFAPELEASISSLAPSSVTVLLVGGSALQLAVAAALHDRSPRAAHPFVVFDCAGRSADAVELGLFGGPAHVTVIGGAIERARAGTLYVGAIDHLPLLTQPRFLRFLDEPRAVRVVAATIGDLVARVERGEFRLDLAERLTLVELIISDDAT